MAWEVSLVGDATDLAMLEQSFHGPDLTISNRGEEYVLTSPVFEALGQAAPIRERARGLLELLNGACRMALDSRTLIRDGAVVFQHPDGRRHMHVSLESVIAHCRASLSYTITHCDGTSETYHPADPVREWLGLAETDAAVAKVLRLMSSGVWDWVNLYRIYEVVEEDYGGIRHVVSKGWATKKAIRLFKQTANSSEAIGADARHGSRSTTPPPMPMSPPEAKSLIQTIVQSWLRAKAGAC